MTVQGGPVQLATEYRQDQRAPSVTVLFQEVWLIVGGFSDFYWFQLCIGNWDSLIQIQLKYIVCCILLIRCLF